MHPTLMYSGFGLLVAILSGPRLTAAQSSPIDLSVAHEYFREAQAVCDRDSGKLWGMSLCGPVLFVDPATRTVVANQGDSQGFLTRTGKVFVGRLPDRQPVANAPLAWAGVKWAMIVWSFMTNDSFQRAKLITHESFHRIQDDLKFPVAGVSNSHLDSRDGRIWLQLEWRALRQALTSKGALRRQAIEDALTFRSYRRSLFPKAAASEIALEMHEGLAEYTGFTLSAKDATELIGHLTRQIDQAAGRPTFVGYFAYASGPAYGVLLDASGAAWLKSLSPQDDLGELLGRSLQIELPTDLKARAEEQSSRYDGGALRVAESEREARRQQQIAEDPRRLVDGATLLLPLTDRRRVALNSSNIVPLEGVGTVAPTATVTDEWGVLEVSNGALMIHSEGGRIIKVYVSIPADVTVRPLTGDGWTLQLNSGWTMAPGQRAGDYVVTRREQ